jgi:hypothetical protein
MSVSVFSIFVYRNTVQDACALSHGRWPNFRHVIISGLFNRYQFLRLDHDIRHFFVYYHECDLRHKLRALLSLPRIPSHHQRNPSTSRHCQNSRQLIVRTISAYFQHNAEHNASERWCTARPLPTASYRLRSSLRDHDAGTRVSGS